MASGTIKKKSGGGGGDYPWFGADTTFVERKISKTINLKDDTTYDSWTASTTQTTIWPQNASYDFEDADLSLTDYTYWYVGRGYVEFVYKTGTTKQKIPLRAIWYFVHKVSSYPSNFSNLQNESYSLASVSNINQSGALYYGNTADKLMYVSSLSNAPAYPNAAPTGTFSSSKFKYKLPGLAAKCYSSYFDVSQKENIDSANTNFIYTVDKYKTPHCNSIYMWLIDKTRTDLLTGL